MLVYHPYSPCMEIFETFKLNVSASLLLGYQRYTLHGLQSRVTTVFYILTRCQHIILDNQSDTAAVEEMNINLILIH